MSMVDQQLLSLNPEQHEVAVCKGHCLAIAAPGSGKTKTLAVKAALILSQGETVVAVTFTRDAAIELRDRILAIAGSDALPRLLVGTFHSIDLLMAFPSKAKSGMGSEILRGGFSRLRRPWEIVKEGTRRSFVDRAITQAGLGMEREEATRVIEGIKSGHRKPDSPEESALVEAYKAMLKRHGVIDFQDILLETNRAIGSGEVSPLKTTHLMVDEFQDTDRIQFDWVMHHAQAGCLITAVGDDDQSIYGFRHALGYSGMVEFKDLLNASRVVLGTNYRSVAEVLAPASQLIRTNQDRMDKDLVSHKGPGGDVWWDKFGNREREAEECHEWARLALLRGESVGVLARTNKRLDAVEAECVRHDTPYQRAEGGSILQTPEMSTFVAALGLLTRDNLRDADEVLAWLRLTEDDIAGVHKTLGDRPFMQLDKAGLAKLPVSTETRSVVASLVKRCIDWRVMLNGGSTTYVVDRVLELLSGARADDRGAQRTFSKIQSVFLRPVSNGTGVVEFEKHLARIRDKMNGKKVDGDQRNEVGKLILLTAHGSKGLEWDNVWVLGAEQGTFPDDSAALQEERRLFYVAMTRARLHLRVSAAGASPTSTFVDEAGIIRFPQDGLDSTV